MCDILSSTAPAKALKSPPSWHVGSRRGSTESWRDVDIGGWGIEAGGARRDAPTAANGRGDIFE